MASKFGTWRQKIQQHPFITVGIIFAFLILIAFAFAVSKFGWDWTGFNGSTGKSTATETTLSPHTKVTTTAQSPPGKTLWDLLQLLAVLAIPVVVGFGAAWFTAQQGKVNEQENKDNQREAALQAYIDKMSELLLEKNLRESSPEDEVRTIARVRTITILFQLDARRIGYLFAFLREAGLMSTTPNDNVVSLNHADLHTVNWSQADLSGANLRGANLRGSLLITADLRGADLSAANLSVAVLRGANLRRALLMEANLSAAVLRGANLRRADLCKTDLREADLMEADLSKADLRGANLSAANLKGATGITREELEKQTKSLEGATMPDGSKHS